MKLLLSALLTLGFYSSYTLAEDKPATPPPAKTDDFNEMKTRRLEMLKERLESMTKLQTCITNASDMTALKACQEAAHPPMMTNRRMHMDGNKAPTPRQRPPTSSAPTTPMTPPSGNNTATPPATTPDTKK